MVGSHVEQIDDCQDGRVCEHLSLQRDVVSEEDASQDKDHSFCDEGEWPGDYHLLALVAFGFPPQSEVCIHLSILLLVLLVV